MKLTKLELDYVNGTLLINDKEIKTEVIVVLADNDPEYPRKKIFNYSGKTDKSKTPVITIDTTAITGV